MIKYEVKYPGKDTPKERWCFVRMKNPRGIPKEVEGEGKYLMWDRHKHWTGIGVDMWKQYPMEEIEYWLEQIEPDKLNKF